jgi:hypothetical protein
MPSHVAFGEAPAGGSLGEARAGLNASKRDQGAANENRGRRERQAIMSKLRLNHATVVLSSSLITLGLAPVSVDAQSQLPPCPSDRNQGWTNCTGVYSFPNGSKYGGEFRKNKQNGQGTMTFANGDKYVGEWSDGKENGQGQLYIWQR